MADLYVSVHELKARLSEYLGKSIYGKERIIIQRRGKPIAMIVPLQNSEIKKGGLANVPWEAFEGLSDFVDQAYQLRVKEPYREIPF